MGCYVVTANAQNLGTLLLNPGVVDPEQGCLLRSTSGEVKYVERQDYMLVPSVLAESDLAVIGGGKLEVRRLVTYLSGHMPAHLSIRIPLNGGWALGLYPRG